MRAATETLKEDRTRRAVVGALPTRACDRCGLRFPVTRASRRYCSEHCQKLAMQVRAYARAKASAPIDVQRCLHCDRRIPVTSRRRKYCSVSCMTEANRLATSATKKAQHPVFTRSCGRCNASFTTRSSRRRFCTKDCAYEAARDRIARQYRPAEPRAHTCKRCETTFEAKYHPDYCETCGPIVTAANARANNRMRDTRGVRGPFTCRNCGTSYMAKRRLGQGETFCGRPCHFDWRRKQTVLREQTALSEGRSRPVFFPRCESCARVFTARVAKSRFCTMVCRRDAQLRPAISTCGRCHQSFERTLHGRVDGPCVACKLIIKKEQMRAYRVRYGSKRIRERCHDFGVTYERVDLLAMFERANWRCESCGVPTPQSLRGTKDDHAPEVDHRIPLSQGGGHTKENVQCLCRFCNSSKGDLMPEQWERAKALYGVEQAELI